MPLKDRVKELREGLGMSLQELADAVGASKAHIWDLEQGRSTNPSIELLKKLADKLKVSVADLVGENPTGKSEDARVVGMFRELKELSTTDLDMIQQMVERLKKSK